MQNFLIPICFLMLVFSACKTHKENPVKNIEELGLIPAPVKVELVNEVFTLDNTTHIRFFSAEKEGQEIASYLSKKLFDNYNLSIELLPSEISEGSLDQNGQKAGYLNDGIILSLSNTSEVPGTEGYQLSVDGQKILISAGSGAGLFYGVQTFLQLLPNDSASRLSYDIPGLTITDYPRFSWRGMHLDVCRHFFPKEFIKKYIDVLAMHKMNTFHWHLTEDQGWRIEIKKYPGLIQIGSKRKETIVDKNFDPFVGDGVVHEGYYSQDDIRDIVEYAKKRYIRVVPEIEMPGHSLAALAAYPKLSCSGGPFEVGTSWGVFEDVYCAGNDSVFTFLEDVLSEVIALFPSEYIHIGGDECPKARWKKCEKCQKRMRDEGLADEHELQSYFIGRIEKFLISKGKNLIGWDEILEGGLAPQATVMSWRGIDGGIAAARQNHDAIMSPGTYCYFDHYQRDPEKEPLAIGGFTDLEKVYSYEPVPDSLEKDKKHHILGAQANVWTEYMSDSKYVEYMVLPRMCALSEAVWSSTENHDYESFMKRLQLQFKRLDAAGFNYCPQ